MKAVLLALLLIGTIYSRSFDNSTRMYGIGYMQRFEFGSTSRFNTMKTDNSLPSLKKFLRFHGAMFYAHLTDDIVIGLKTFGALSESSNNNGFSSLGGAVGGFFVQYHWKIKEYGTVYVGTTLSCGRFSYTSQTNKGSGIIGFNDNFFFEPTVGGNIHIPQAFTLNIEYSRFIISGFGNAVWNNGDKTTKIVPDGNMIGAGILWGIPAYL
ncbi:MAG TPA: hypothetical protein VHO70_11115 [Chitinispirillaceae bacterium]|nr:hypothetical protein [Chitinispirillaceae bacterium]